VNVIGTFDEVNVFMAAFPGLTYPQFRAWYCKAIYALGCHAFTDAADEARNGREPAKLFWRLLKAKLGGSLR